MNDAGPSLVEYREGWIGWCQVSLSPRAFGPAWAAVHPLLLCLTDSLSRVGSYALEGVVSSVPVVPETTDQQGDSFSKLLEASEWCTMASPHARRRVCGTVSIDGSAHAIRPGDEIMSLLRQMHNATVTGFTIDDTRASLRLGEVPAELEHGQSSRQMFQELRWSGTLAEWSLDSVAWMMAMLAHACGRSGEAGPIEISIELA